MQYFQPKQDRDGTTEYRWRDAEEGPKVFTATVAYQKNNHRNAPRGIYLKLRESEVTNEGVFTSEKFMLFGGRSKNVLLEAVARGNPKKVQAWAEKVDAGLPELCAAWHAGVPEFNGIQLPAPIADESTATVGA